VDSSFRGGACEKRKWSGDLAPSAAHAGVRYEEERIALEKKARSTEGEGRDQGTQGAFRLGGHQLERAETR